MGLFQKKPQVSSSVPLYTLGLAKNILIVGLGNPGKKYEGTRHNIGFYCIDDLARKLQFAPWSEKKQFKCLITQQNISDNKVILIKPKTYMNLSGQSVQAAAKFYKVPNHLITVIYDELAMPFGQIRTRLGGSSAGHNGVQSVIEHVGEDFGRLRIGIRSDITEKDTSSDFVLSKFSKMEQAELPAMTREVTSILSEFAHGQLIGHQTRSFLI